MYQQKQRKLLVNAYEDMPLPHPDQHAQEVKLKVISMRQASTMQTLKEASLSGEADVKVQLPATPSPVLLYQHRT